MARIEDLKKMRTILNNMATEAKDLMKLDQQYGTYNTDELDEQINNMLYWLNKEIEEVEA